MVLALLLPLGGNFFNSVATAAEWSTPTFGGSGGTRSYNLDCGRGGVLVGLTFKSGSWIDEIGVVCRKVSSSTGRLGEEFTRGPVGGAGGNPRISKCVSGGVIGSVHWTFNGGTLSIMWSWDAMNGMPHENAREGYRKSPLPLTPGPGEGRLPVWVAV